MRLRAIEFRCGSQVVVQKHYEIGVWREDLLLLLPGGAWHVSAAMRVCGPVQVMPLLKAVPKCWQPADFLPPSEDPDFMDKLVQLRSRAANLPDDYLVVFVGDMITEEALPTYMSMLNTLDGVRDETGASLTPWAQWTRQWTAEENRHGDVMNKYIYLTGRVNMKSIEVTIQNLIGSGMDPKTENNPYLGFLYTSFQERATKVGACMHADSGPGLRARAHSLLRKGRRLFARVHACVCGSAPSCSAFTPPLQPSLPHACMHVVDNRAAFVGSHTCCQSAYMGRTCRAPADLTWQHSPPRLGVRR